MRAKIVKNKVCCPICGKELGNTADYKEVIVNGKSYTEFKRYCDNKQCTSKLETYSYLLDLTLEESIRFVVDEKEIKEVQE